MLQTWTQSRALIRPKTHNVFTLNDLPRPDRIINTEKQVNLSSQPDRVIHTIEIPNEGQYLGYFKIFCYPARTRNNQIYIVCKSINRVALVVNDRIIHSININHNSSDQYIKLPFMNELPLITGALTNSKIQLKVYLSEPVHMDYFIRYQVGYINNFAITYDMTNSLITVCNQIKYFNGEVHLIDNQISMSAY